MLAGAGVAVSGAFAAPKKDHPVRPPGSLPEEEFLQACIRCGECFQACPNDVLQPTGFEQGWEALWTPRVNADWAGLRIALQQLRPGLPHRRHPRAAHGGEAGGPHGPGER